MYRNEKPRQLVTGRAYGNTTASRAGDFYNKPWNAPLQAPSREGKLTISVLDWKPLERNTLRGFATIMVKELQLAIRDCAVHERDGKRWVQLPSKPQIERTGNTIKNEAGKVQYVPILEFGTRKIADAFSARVLE